MLFQAGAERLVCTCCESRGEMWLGRTIKWGNRYKQRFIFWVSLVKDGGDFDGWLLVPESLLKAAQDPAFPDSPDRKWRQSRQR